MKAALITEDQIKAIEDVLGELTAIVGSEQEYKQLNALAIVKSLKVQDNNLISAAPDLLEAAKCVIAWYEAEDDHSKEPDFWKRVVMSRESEFALRSAIAKATGEQA